MAQKEKLIELLLKKHESYPSAFSEAIISPMNNILLDKIFKLFQKGYEIDFKPIDYPSSCYRITIRDLENQKIISCSHDTDLSHWRYLSEDVDEHLCSCIDDMVFQMERENKNDKK